MEKIVDMIEQLEKMIDDLHDTNSELSYEEIENAIKLLREVKIIFE